MNSFRMIFVSSFRLRREDWFGIFGIVSKGFSGMVFISILFIGFLSCGQVGNDGGSEDDARGSISGILLNAIILDLPATAPSREITLTARLENISDETQGVTVTFYRSTDRTISTQDMRISDPVRETLPARQSGQTPPELNSSYTIPSGDTRYSYGYCVSTTNGGACARSNVTLDGIALVKTRLDATCPARDNSVGSTTQLDTTTTSINYTLTFNRRWSAATHPTNYPSGRNPHFTPLVGASHNDSVVFWRRGEFATKGVEIVAEDGITGTFSGEITAQGTNAVAATSPSGSSVTLTVSEAHPFVTMISMLAPSPDWFMGIGGLDMRVGGSTDTFYNKVTVPLRLYDAGTESSDKFDRFSGQDTGPDADESLRERITRLSTRDEDTDFGNNNNPEGTPCVGTFTITIQ